VLLGSCRCSADSGFARVLLRRRLNELAARERSGPRTAASAPGAGNRTETQSSGRRRPLLGRVWGPGRSAGPVLASPSPSAVSLRLTPVRPSRRRERMETPPPGRDEASGTGKRTRPRPSQVGQRRRGLGSSCCIGMEPEELCGELSQWHIRGRSEVGGPVRGGSDGRSPFDQTSPGHVSSWSNELQRPASRSLHYDRATVATAHPHIPAATLNLPDIGPSWARHWLVTIIEIHGI
jgi:hypothetical protein